MASRKKRRSRGKGRARSRRATKPAKAVAVDEDEARQSAVPAVTVTPQKLSDDDMTLWRIEEGTREIEPTVYINEATGRANFSFRVGQVDGEWFPLKQVRKENQTEQKQVQIDEEMNCIAKTCTHGYHSLGESESICIEFVKTFDAAFAASRDAGEHDCFCLFKAGVDATFIKYADVWKSTKRMEWMRSFYLSLGARIVLEIDDGSGDRHAFMCAVLAHFFGQYISNMILLETQPTMNWWLLEDLRYCGDFSLLRFFKEGIPCSCLDEKYEDAESSLDLDEAPKDMWHCPAIQQVMKKNAMRRKEVKLVVDSTFKSDQLFQHALPDSHTLKKRIHSPKTKTLCIGCPERVHASHPELPRLTPLGQEMMNKFYIKFTCEYNAAGGVINHNIRVAYLATREEFAGVWNSPAVIENMSSTFLILGTEYLLRGNNMAASHYASLAYSFEQHVACNLLKERLSMNWPKINELYFEPDEHTLVSFFKKRITCSCLDAKYKEVRSVTKLGLCYNINCPHPGRKVERSLTKCCFLCRRVNYCSRECQVENWDLHKQYCCDAYVEEDVAAINLD